MTLPIDFEMNPLVPAVIQDDASGDVLMVGFMNQLAYEQTQETGFVHFWSRSRNTLWKKGETSGHTQEVISIALNCEANSLLIQVLQKGAVCHTGHTTCYYRQILPDGSLLETSDPVFDPKDVYEAVHPANDAGTRHQQWVNARLVATWFGAYEYLAQQPLQDVSRTSRLLHDGSLPFARIADEIDELAGVLAGEHSHSGDLIQDVILEGSQVLYWLNVLAVNLKQKWDGILELERVMTTQFSTDESVDANIKNLREAAEVWRLAEAQSGELRSDTAKILLEELSGAYQLVARVVSPIVEPSRLIEHDLEELRSRPYLADYFSSVEA